MSETCGYAVVNADGIDEPCGREATGWRWYQDCEHEDLLDVACATHENEGGKRMHDAEALLDRLCMGTITDRGDEHRQFTCLLRCGHRGPHDDLDGGVWTDANHHGPSTLNQRRRP